MGKKKEAEPSIFSHSTTPSTAHSCVESTHLVLPPDTNSHGTAFGGKIMQWMDIIAGIAAARHTHAPVVTAAVDSLVFTRPIRMGDVVILKASVNYAGRTSLEVGVRVEREDLTTGERKHCLTGYFTMVAVNTQGKPARVPPFEPQSEEEKRRYGEAKIRREHRLALRSAISSHSPHSVS